MRTITVKKRDRGPRDGDTTGEQPGKKRVRTFEEGESARELALAHHIATARIPIRALTTKWSMGSNRPVDARHVRRLRDVFLEGTLNRTARENRLLVLGTRAEVEGILQPTNGRIDDSDSDGSGEQQTPIPSPHNWPGPQLEVMAGQHRIRALEAYVELTNAGADELWWTCEVYDRGR